MILRRLSSLLQAVLLVGAACFGLLAAAPGFAGLHPIVVAGGSMTGTIDIGSIAITRTIDVDDVRPGKIIVFVPPGGHVPVMHRVVDMRRQGKVLVIHTKGDANKTVDPHATKMKGKGEEVVAHIPYMGYVLHWIHSVPLWLMLLGLFAVALLHPFTDLIRHRGRHQSAQT